MERSCPADRRNVAKGVDRDVAKGVGGEEIRAAQLVVMMLQEARVESYRDVA